MIKFINDFVFYHPYTITGLYVFVGIMLGFIVNFVLIFLANILTKITKKRIDKFVKRIIKYYFIIFFTTWGIYNSAYRIIEIGSISTILTAVYDIINIYVISKLVLEFVLAFISLRSKKETDSLTSTSIVENVIKIIGYIAIIFIMLTRLNIPITPILTALGVGGIAIALAFQDILSNLFSGIFVIASSQLKPGDFVKIQNGPEGFVVDISWRNTTIRELAGNHVYVPNSIIATSAITNYRHPDYEVRVPIHFSVSYGSDLDFVERTAYDVGKEIQMFEPGAVKSYEPIFRIDKLSDYSIDCILYMRASTYVDQYAIRTKTMKAIHDKFREVGIEIPFPITTIKKFEDDI